jgi:hypothetical protein
MTDDARRLLTGRWLHSHEEDTPTQSVYRPEGFSFAPARGRRGFELHADGSCTWIGIAPQDGSAESPCTWEFAGGKEPRAILHMAPGKSEVMRIASIDKGKLVVHK